jgi:hypothetical protein
VAGFATRNDLTDLWVVAFDLRVVLAAVFFFAVATVNPYN